MTRDFTIGVCWLNSGKEKAVVSTIQGIQWIALRFEHLWIP